MPTARYSAALLVAGAFSTVWLAPPVAVAPAQQPPAPLKRLSLAEFAKNEKLVASFRRGVQRMRELKSTDPRSHVFQANIHWRPLFPVYVYQQADKGSAATLQLFRDDPGFTPDPNVFNQCPHGNWWFLPWHRAYLYYFERILRWAAEDPGLTLPYWNYSDPEQRELPSLFREAKVGGKDNPLYLPESATFKDAAGQPQVFLMRDGPFLRGVTQLTPSATSLRALGVVPFTNVKPLPGNAGFGSPQACDATCSCGFGALESIPHNRIHIAIGGSSAQAGGSVRVGFMGDVSTAARDPVFWAHHANVDRLWASWVKLGQDRKNPQDPEWLQASFTFFDVAADGTPKPVTITVEQLLTTERLGYVYDKLEQLPPTVAVRKSLALLGGGQNFRPLAGTPPAPPDVAPHKGRPEPGGIRLSTVGPKTVPLPLAAGAAPGPVRDLLTGKGDERGGVTVLSLEGIEFDQPPGVDYEVYLNLPAKAKASPDSPSYVGTLTFFGLARHPGTRGHGGRTAPVYVKFALPEALGKALAADKDSVTGLRVTFVPQTGTEPVRPGASVPAPAERTAVTIRQVRLLQVR